MEKITHQNETIVNRKVVSTFQRILHKYWSEFEKFSKKLDEITKIDHIKIINPCPMDFEETSNVDVLNIIKSTRKTSIKDNNDIPTNISIKSSCYLSHLLRY